MNEFEKIEKQIADEWQIYSSEELLNTTFPDARFLVKDLIPKSGITILAGNPSCGKSWLLFEIARVVSEGIPLFGTFETEKSKVLYVDEETPAWEGQRRWKMLGGTNQDVSFMSLQGFKIDDSFDRNKLLKICLDREIEFLIFDAMRDVNSRNENDSKEAQELMDCFKEFTKKGITILTAHHLRKESFMNSREPNQVLRGSTSILANIDSLISVEKIKEAGQVIELILVPSKLRQGKLASSFKIKLIEEEGKMTFQFNGNLEGEEGKLEKAKEMVIETLKNGERYRTEIIQVLIPFYFKERTIQRAISELEEEKKIKPRKGEMKRIYFSLTEG